MTVALVGGGGLIGRATRDVLRAQRVSCVSVDRIRVDRTRIESTRVDQGRVESTRIDEVALDILSPAAPEALRALFVARGVRSVVHLAARVDPATDKERAAMRRLHVEGTRVVAHAARAVGARLVLVSSATVYGAWPDNDAPLTESAPLRPNPGFDYAHDKVLQEQIAADIVTDLAIARPAIVYGPTARNYLTEILRWMPVLPALDGRTPPLQFTHVDDVAHALVWLARSDVQGVFNVAHDWLSFAALAALLRRRIVRVPSSLLRVPLGLGARHLPAHLRAPAELLPYLRDAFVVSSAKLQAAGSWRPVVSAADAVRSVMG